MRLSWLAGAQILVAAGILAGCSSNPPAEQSTTEKSEVAADRTRFVRAVPERTRGARSAGPD